MKFSESLKTQIMEGAGPMMPFDSIAVVRGKGDKLELELIQKGEAMIRIPFEMPEDGRFLLEGIEAKVALKLV